MTRRQPPRVFLLLPRTEEPFHFELVPKDHDRCPETFPPAPEIRCQKGLHTAEDGCCYATHRDPYFSIFWEKRSE